MGTPRCAVTRADKRVPGDVLGIARLLADEHERRLRRGLAENGLRGVRVPIARLAVLRGGTHARERGPGGNQISGRALVASSSRQCRDSGEAR